ncbi:eppin-like, partial [Gymnogyps californianus]|uniref:eppin-like n=1 Tax=Gymnogyps californianus TaxID=33616 RepID=UPI0021C6B572
RPLPAGLGAPADREVRRVPPAPEDPPEALRQLVLLGRGLPGQRALLQNQLRTGVPAPHGSQTRRLPQEKGAADLRPCNSSCSDDTDCPRHEKCCFTGCGRGCLPPDRGTAAPLLPAGWGHWLGPAASNGPMSSGDICHLPPVTGPCRGRFRHYAYNPATGTCQPFIYSGCGGNPNNFNTVEECQQVCQQRGRAKE